MSRFAQDAQMERERLVNALRSMPDQMSMSSAPPGAGMSMSSAPPGAGMAAIGQEAMPMAMGQEAPMPMAMGQEAPMPMAMGQEFPGQEAPMAMGQEFPGQEAPMQKPPMAMGQEAPMAMGQEFPGPALNPSEILRMQIGSAMKRGQRR